MLNSNCFLTEQLGVTAGRNENQRVARHLIEQKPVRLHVAIPMPHPSSVSRKSAADLGSSRPKTTQNAIESFMRHPIAGPCEFVASLSPQAKLGIRLCWPGGKPLRGSPQELP